MAERFNILQTLNPQQLSTDNPSVQISAARILEDTQTGQKYLQVKFVNNGEQTITGLDITVKSGDARIAIQHFTDLNLKCGETSGSKTLIELPNETNAFSFRVAVSKIQWNNFSDVPSQNSPSAQNVGSKAPHYALSIPSVIRTSILLISALLIVFTLAFSFFAIFRVYVTAPRSYDNDCFDINLYQITSKLSDSTYSLPATVFIGVYGYLISSVLAIIACIFSARKKRSIPFLRITPFFSLGFQIFLLATIADCYFVSFSDVSSGNYILRECTANPATPIWLFSSGLACFIYAAFLLWSIFISKKKISISTLAIPITEIVLVAGIPLVGISMAENHITAIDNAEIRANLNSINQTIDTIAKEYGFEELRSVEVFDRALTKATQPHTSYFMKESKLFDLSRDEYVGSFCCLAVIDEASPENTAYYNFWDIWNAEDSTIDSSNNNNSTAESTPSYAGYWTNGDASDPYYLGIQVDSSGSTPVLEVQVYSDYYHWTATAHQSTSNVFTYENGFQQSHSEDFNLPDLTGTVTFNFDKNTVTWDDDSGESIVFTDSISDDVFNTFVNKTAAAANSYADNSQSNIDPIDLAGHYWCEQNSGDAYISMYSAPDNDQEVGNIEIYSQLEKANFSGVLYSIGDNQYETIDELGNHWNLAFYGSSDSPAFELHYILPSGNYQSFGEYVLDEHYYS